jgi:hypothetical protein
VVQGIAAAKTLVVSACLRMAPRWWLGIFLAGFLRPRQPSPQLALPIVGWLMLWAVSDGGANSLPELCAHHGNFLAAHVLPG